MSQIKNIDNSDDMLQNPVKVAEAVSKIRTLKNFEYHRKNGEAEVTIKMEMREDFGKILYDKGIDLYNTVKKLAKSK